MKTLNKHDIQKLEEYWSNYKQNKQQLKYREWELMSRNSDDENTGGGANSVRTISKPTEQLATRLIEDKLYQNLKQITHVVESLYHESEGDLKVIVDMRYWDAERNCYEWEEIADQLNMSRSKVLRLRNGLLDDTADLIGWV